MALVAIAAAAVPAARGAAAEPVPIARAVAAAESSCPGADSVMTTEAARREGLATILCLVNAERRERGRSDLRRSGRLAGVAQRHSADMARFKYVAHVDHAGRGVRARVARSGYRASYAGEAIGWSTGTGRSPERLLRAVLADRAHRDAVFRSRYRELGVGLVLAAPVAGRRDGATVTLVLGRR